MEISGSMLNRPIFWRSEPCGTVLAYIGQSSYGLYVHSEKEYFIVQTKLAFEVAPQLSAFKVALYERTERMGDGSTKSESPLTNSKRKRGENQPHMSSLTWLSNGLRPLTFLRKRRHLCRLTFQHASQPNRPRSHSILEVVSATTRHNRNQVTKAPRGRSLRIANLKIKHSANQG